MRLDGDDDLGCARGIAADELNMIALRQLKQPGAELRKPGFIGGGQGEVQHKPRRLRAHGGEVA